MTRESPFPSPTRTLAVLGAVLVSAVILFLAREVFIPLALAILLAFLLAPIVERLERIRIPRIWAVLAAVGLATVVVVGFGFIVEEQVKQLAVHMPRYKDNLSKKLESLELRGGLIDRAGDTIAELGKEFVEKADGPKPEVPERVEPMPVQVVEPPTPPVLAARNLIRPILRPLALAGIVVVFTVFLLIQREDVRDRFIRLVGLGRMHVTTTALDDAARRVSRYLLLQFIVNGGTGLVIGIGLLLLGVPGALLWGLVTALFRFIPYVGTWIAAALPVAISLADSPNWSQPLMALGMIVVIELVVANVIEPLLFGSHTGVSPLALIAAAVFWTWLWGPVGLLLATPLTVCLVVIGKHVPALEFLDVLLGDAPVLTPETRLYQRLLAGDSEEAGEIVTGFAEGKPLVEVYDALLLPALRLAESVRHRGGLDSDRDRTMHEMLGVMIEDLGERQGVTEVDSERGLVMCLPARDRADHRVARMAQQLLTQEGMRAEVPPEESLTGEMIEQVATLGAAVVCISAVPPGAIVHTRVLCKRLRARFPEMPIVVGLWGAENPAALKERLSVEGIHIVTGLQEAIGQVRSLAGYAAVSPAVTP